MASLPALDEQETTATAPLPGRLRAKRLVALYAVLATIAVVGGIVVGVQRHDAAAIRSAAAPTEQMILATAPPGQPTPTPLATKVPTPTAPPTEPSPTALPATVVPPTVAPPTPVPPVTPAVAAPVRSAPVGNQNDQHNDGKGSGKGKEKGKGKGD